MKVALDKRKAKKARLDNNSHLVEPPWVYKPMPYSMSILFKGAKGLLRHLNTIVFFIKIMVFKVNMVFFIKLKIMVKMSNNHFDQTDNHQERILQKKEEKLE